MMPAAPKGFTAKHFRVNEVFTDNQNIFLLVTFLAYLGLFGQKQSFQEFVFKTRSDSLLMMVTMFKNVGRFLCLFPFFY